MEQLRKLIFTDWLPKLCQYKAAHVLALEKQQNVVGGSSRTKLPQLEAIVQELTDMEEKCAAIQALFVECIVKALRGNPVRSRMSFTDLMFDCNAALDAAGMRAKSLEVLFCLSM
jgi:hypothetical protein